jgi:hypothetical protein
MNAEYVQGLRYKLQKRFRRLNSVGWDVFHQLLKQFWGYLCDQSTFAGMLGDIERRCVSCQADAERIVNEEEELQPDNELDAVGISYFVIKMCVESDNLEAEVNVGRTYCGATQHNDAVEFFRNYFVETLYEYLDEQLDDQRAILALLVRYKQKCEWFSRKALYAEWEADTSKGEKTLAFDLYEYLHDQGMSFHLEPSSASGEIDIISAQGSENPLLADAKIFNPEKGKGTDYLARAVNQLYVYTLDYNEPVGYLVIYKTCADDLRLALSNQSASIPYLVHNNKTIFFVVIDIFPHPESASKRGPLKPIEITEEDLVRFSRQASTA